MGGTNQYVWASCTHYYKANIFPYRPEEGVLLDSKSLSVYQDFDSVIREVNYFIFQTEWED